MDVALKKTVQTVLEREGLWRYVNEAASQFLRPGHLFCHLVLNDASQQERVNECMAKVERDVGRSGRFEVIVRSLWMGQSGPVLTSRAIRKGNSGFGKRSRHQQCLIW